MKTAFSSDCLLPFWDTAGIIYSFIYFCRPLGNHLPLSDGLSKTSSCWFCDIREVLWIMLMGALVLPWSLGTTFYLSQSWPSCRFLAWDFGVSDLLKLGYQWTVAAKMQNLLELTSLKRWLCLFGTKSWICSSEWLILCVQSSVWGYKEKRR